jgi:hypothetical protein
MTIVHVSPLREKARSDGLLVLRPQGEGGHRHVPRPGADGQTQHILDHTSIKTTEIDIKARLPDLVAPTLRPILPKRKVDRSKRALDIGSPTWA